jgi:hypothetical protein
MAIRTHGPDPLLPGRLWTACQEEMSNPDACIHPIGHANAIIAFYDPLKAFDSCDSLFPDIFQASSCWQGVMMEYIDRSAPGAPSEEYGNPADVYAPCNSSPRMYESSCVRLHIHYLMAKLGYDFPKISLYCRSFVSQETVDACMEERGVMAAQSYFYDTDHIKEICRFDMNYQARCSIGAVVFLMSAHGRAESEQLCAHIQKENGKKECYERIEYMSR